LTLGESGHIVSCIQLNVVPLVGESNEMSAHCAALNIFGSDDWNARAYGSLSIASRVSASVRSNAQTLAVRKQLVKLNSSLDDFFAAIRDAMDGKTKVTAPQESTPESIAKSKATLEELDRLLSRTYLQAKHAGLTNRTVTAGQFHKMREHIDELQDLREWFEMMSNPGPVKELFARAEREADAEPFDLSKVR
jgi:hypothetical protein